MLYTQYVVDPGSCMSLESLLSSSYINISFIVHSSFPYYYLIPFLFLFYVVLFGIFNPLDLFFQSYYNLVILI